VSAPVRTRNLTPKQMEENKNFYIDYVKIAGFRSLWSTEVKLLPGLNILIGKNGSGKSNILNFLLGCADVFSSNPVGLRHEMLSTSFNFHFLIKASPYELVNERENGNFKLNINHDTASLSTFIGELNLLSRIRRKYMPNEAGFYAKLRKIKFPLFYSLVAFSLPQKVFKKYSQGIEVIITVKPSKQVELIENENFDPENPFSFSNFIQWLNVDIYETISKKSLINSSASSAQDFPKNLSDLVERDTWKKINDCLSKYSPMKEFSLNKGDDIYDSKKQQIKTTYYLEFLVDDAWQRWENLSDGTQRMFYLITEVLLAEGFVLIEEPELGIHPHQFFKIMQFLKEQSAHKQIIISTHAPEALDVLGPDELDRIVFTRMTPEGTQTSHLDEKQKRKAQRYLREKDNLSNYWKHSDLEPA
jgi:AAA15 family ATPase/GTPase